MISLSFKDIPIEERPRERLVLRGPESLSLTELIAVVLGKGTRDDSVSKISYEIVAKFGGIRELSKLNVKDWESLRGIGLAKATSLVAVFELGKRLDVDVVEDRVTCDTADKIYTSVKRLFQGLNQEHLVVLSLDSRRRLIAVDDVSVGTVDEVLIHSREVFKAAINRRASYVAIAHNHPSGDLNPSNNDVNLTERLQSVSYTIGIPLIDHIIVGKNSFTSMKSEEYIA